MKKLLLIGLALGVSFSSFSQTKVAKSENELAKNRTERRADITFKKQTTLTTNEVALKTSNAVLLDRAEMGKSGNAYSVLTSYQRCMAYDETTGAILGTFRADPATYPEALGSGSVMSFYSTDGASFDAQLTLNPDPAVHALRYPSGIIYNPEASSDLSETYTVVAGPSHLNGTWDYTFYGVSGMNAGSQSDYYHAWASENDWARSSMTVVPEAVYNTGQDYTSVGDLGVDQTMKQYVGTTDNPADGFDWEFNTATPDWLIDESDGHAVALYTAWSAWSKDGSIGYMWLVGVSNDSYDYGVYQPQIMYTEDGGDSWDEIELNLEDYPTLVEFLPPWEDDAGNPGTVRPSFLTGDRTYPGVVDYDGKLHLFSNVFGSSKGDVLNADNGYWVVGDIKGGHIFDFVINPDGIQDVIFVDSVMTEEAADNAFGDVTWNHRLQVSKSIDEKVVFAVWADDENSDDGTLKNPNLYAWAYNTEVQLASEPTNFTGEDLYAGFYFFHYVAEYTPLVNGFYNIPVSTSITPNEFGANDATAPITHTYVSGIGFNQVVGIDEALVTNNSSFSLSQNQPNPFSKQTSFTINSNIDAAASIQVTNMMGQIVFAENLGTINGSYKVVLDANTFKSGIYFYSVRIGDETISKKMIVE